MYAALMDSETELKLSLRQSHRVWYELWVAFVVVIRPRR